MTTPESASNEHDTEEVICYSKLAREGISLLLNNKQNEAEALFKSYPQSIQMNAGFAFAVVTDALMTFEDDKLQLALQTLKDIEKKCSSNMSWMRSVKTRVFGTTDSTSYAEQLESQIILADSYVFVATLTFLQQDITSYFKGGWVLRKSYKHYQQVYNEIIKVYNEVVKDGQTPPEINPSPIGTSEATDMMTPVPQNSEKISPTSNSNFNTSDERKTAIPEEIEATEPPVDNDKMQCLILEGSQISSVNENATPAPSLQNKNGYKLSPFLKKTTFETHSISCCENLCSLPSPTSFADKPLKNGFIIEDGKHARSAATQIRPFLKKSTSFNNAFDDTFERRSSLRNNISLSYFTSTFNIFITKTTTKDMDKETISRLLCAVSFGYGLLQLGISLLPPSMLRVTSFLGFGGNRKCGLDNLMFARLGTDMRAPFATLALLWYHTIVRPFFALDGNNVEAGVEAAARLIEESKEEYGESALFLFFKGRVERLNSDIPEAIKAFQASKENAAQREIKMMSLHEVGWCYLIQLDFSRSENTFSTLRQSSRWSRPFYSYLTIISAGSNQMFQTTNEITELRSIFQPVPKGTQLDEFLNRRYKIFPIEEEVLKGTNCLFWKLLIYELLYLWNTLPSCTNERLHIIIDDCKAAIEMNCEPMVGLANLIEGSCLCILRRVNDGIEKFRECLERRKDLPYTCNAAHVSAFAQYELGLLLIRNEYTLAEGKKLLQLVAYNYKDYDFEQRLSVRVHAILKNI